MSAWKREAAKGLVAGDEWVDEKTEAFVRELAKVMSRDPDLEDVKAVKGKVRFVHVQKGGMFGPNYVPLVLDVKEFGYPPNSESLNGTIYSEKVRGFRIPGGFTKTRDPMGFWKEAKDSLMDIIRRAGG